MANRPHKYQINCQIFWIKYQGPRTFNFERTFEKYWKSLAKKKNVWRKPGKYFPGLLKEVARKKLSYLVLKLVAKFWPCLRPRFKKTLRRRIRWYGVSMRIIVRTLFYPNHVFSFWLYWWRDCCSTVSPIICISWSGGGGSSGVSIPVNTNHLYNIYTMLLGRRCINVIHMFSVYLDVVMIHGVCYHKPLLALVQTPCEYRHVTGVNILIVVVWIR